MKNSFKILVACSLLASATGCDSFLDINENTNSPLTATPDAILAQALKVTADNYSIGFNYYSSFANGQLGKSGTVNGYPEERTYNYTSAFSSGLFNATYDNLYDYDIIEKQGKATGLLYHSAIAKIMKVYNYQLLVDQYGDIPYSQALQGGANITPKYDKAEDIYKDFIVKLNEAIAEIKAADAGGNVRAVRTEDIVFAGDMARWTRFANSLKLRVLMRQSSAPALDTYVRTEMAKLETDAAASGGYITSDVEVQPGYVQSEGQQNPFFNRFRATAAGGSSQERLYTIGTRYIMAQYYDNHDPRGYRIYNTIGGKFVGVTLGETLPPLGNAASRFRDFGGVFKGLDAPVPLMLSADNLFPRSEAKLRGFFTGGDAGAKTDYVNGITASFAYFYRPAPSRRGSSTDSSAFVPAKVAKYTDANLTNGLVNWEATTTTEREGPDLGDTPALVGVPLATPRVVTTQEKIIYQKYLAVNAVASTEAWDAYRRTGFPRFKPSVQSISTRADKLPVRLLYPLSEVTTNAGNVPALGAGAQFTAKIFWDVVD